MLGARDIVYHCLCGMFPFAYLVDVDEQEDGTLICTVDNSRYEIAGDDVEGSFVDAMCVAMEELSS